MQENVPINKLTVSSSPHLFRKDDTSVIMKSVILALIPAIIVSLIFFGLGAFKLLIVAVSSSIFFEWLFIRIFNNKGTIKDGSALLTGILIGFNLPATSPWWLIVIGSAVAILFGKQVYGGLGCNPFNPALAARVFLLISWPTEMTTFSKTSFMADAVSSATPLSILKTDGVAGLQKLGSVYSNTNMSIGNLGGSVGEVSAIALLLGAIFLLYKGYITWHIPASFIGTVALITGLFYLTDNTTYASPLFHILSGGLMLGALFMATDMVTSPVTSKGMIIFGIGCGLLTAVIRLFGAFPEGVSFAILIMNAFTPIIDRYVKPPVFGQVKKK